MISAEKLRREAENISDFVVGIRRSFHMYPELGMEEFETSKKIKSVLKDLGIDFRDADGTGVIATIYGNKENGPTIGIRADMDALPVQEKKNVSYRSKTDGKMHACGHDAHCAILLGTARILNSIRDTLPGNVRLIFQPAEETCGGADRMIQEGALQNPEVGAVFGLHMDESINTGYIGVKYGKMYAASNPFKLIIKGSSSHGAYPHKGVDAIAISAQIVTALQTIVSREVNPVDSAVITIGAINGGNACNIICDEVVLDGIIRTIDYDTRVFVKKRLSKVAGGIAESMRGSCQLDIVEGYPCLINDDKMVDLIKSSASKILGADRIVMLDKPNLGVEDFAYFGKHVPSVFIKLGCRNEEKEIVYPAHSSMFDIDEDSLIIGVLAETQMVIDYLCDGFSNV